MYQDLSEYTGIPVDRLKVMCPKAGYGLAWEWYQYDNPLDFYRNTGLYIYDLTYYQHDILGEKFYTGFDRFVSKVGGIGLDLGGGIGEYTIHAMLNGCDMVYVDVEGKTKDYAEWRFKKNDLDPPLLIATEDYNLDRDFNFVIATDVFEHMENPEERIKEIAEHTTFLLANPEQVRYNDLYPMHISHYDLTGYFDFLGGALWRVKK